MEPYICIKFTTDIPISSAIDKQIIILEQHDGKLIWAMYKKNKEYKIYDKAYSQQSLKEFLEQISGNKNEYMETILSDSGRMYIVTQDRDIYIGQIYIKKNNATLDTASDNIPKCLFNVNHILTTTPSQLQHYLQQHIPINDIINYHNNFPNQHVKDRNILFHYDPRISMHIPCAITIVNPGYRKYTNTGWSETQYIHDILSRDHQVQLLLLPEINSAQNDEFISINIGDMLNIHKISQKTSDYTQNIEHITRYLYETFIRSTPFQRSKQHEKIHMLRAIQQHSESIAHNIYTTAIAHLQHHKEIINLTLPKGDVTNRT